MSSTFQYFNKEFDLDEINNSIFKKISKLFPVSVEYMTNESYNFYNQEYKKKKEFDKAIEFLKYNLEEINDDPELKLPLLEIEINLYRSMYLAFSSFYKEALINIRATIELILYLTSYDIKLKGIDSDSFDSYLNGHTNIIKEIREWLNSKKDTPFKKKFIKELETSLVYKQLVEETNFPNFLDNTYKQLCNFVHTKGYNFSHLKLHNKFIKLDYPPEFFKESMNAYLDFFISAVQIISILAVASRPELLDEKFALEVELQTDELPDGLWGGATTIFFELIPEEYKQFFNKYHIKI